MNRKYTKGFTLAELLVTLAIISILTSVVGSNFFHILKNTHRVTVLNTMIGTMQLARSQAITQNRRVTMCASDDGLTCGNDWSNGWLIFVDTSRDGQVNGAEITIRTVNDISHLSITPGNITNRFMYRPNGRIMVNNNIRRTTGQFTICDVRGSNYAKAIVIDSSGRPRASKLNLDRSPIICL